MTAQTAMIEVKYVNPPKEGKQYGSVKGANNDSWPVKADRIREFEPNNKYEIAFTEGNNGFRNIIGVKRIMAEPLPNGDLIRNNLPAQQGTRKPQGDYWQPKPPDPATARRIVICGIVNGWAHTGRIERNVEAVTQAIDIAAAGYDRSSLAETPGD